MRIGAGRFKGMILAVPPGRDVRPTGDRARSALFNVLMHRFQNQDGFVLEERPVLDVFAGSGALGLEALSRGAPRAVFMDNGPASLQALRQNIATCRAEAETRVVRADALSPPAVDAKGPAGLIFMDPPYADDSAARALDALGAAGWIAPGAYACVETPAKRPPPAWPAGWNVADERRHGVARITILIHSGN